MEENKTRKYQSPKKITPEHQELMVKIGEKLQELRKAKKISSSGLAKEVRISRNAYHQLESGKVYFNVLSLLQVLDYHQILVSSFFENL